MNKHADKNNSRLVKDTVEGSFTDLSTRYLRDDRPRSVIQRKQAEAIPDKDLAQQKTNGAGLPDQLRAGIENLSGYSMDDVRVHYNSDKPDQLGAHAYAQGTDIHLAAGQEKHLPHEAWHVVQQKQGRVKPTIQMKGNVNINDDKGLETEADRMGAQALWSGSGNREKIMAGGSLYGVIQRLPKFKDQEAAIIYFEDTILDNLDEHLADLDLLKAQATRMGWDDLLERISHYTADNKTVITGEIKNLDLKDKANLKVIKTLLEKVQENGWDDLEELLLPALRKLEDDKTLVGFQKGSDRKFLTMDDLPDRIRELSGKNIDQIKMALNGIFWGRFGTFNDDPDSLKLIKDQVEAAIRLYGRVQSVLSRGVLKPTDLAKDKIDFTPSSDSSNQDQISMLDIDMDRRNPRKLDERFTYPGHQSIGPVLERRSDFDTLVRSTYEYALKGNPMAIKQFELFRSHFPKQFNEVGETAKSIGPMWDIIMKGSTMQGPLYRTFMAMLVQQDHVKKLMEKRASRSAMFISAGSKLTTNPMTRYQAPDGPRVQELRIDRSMEPEGISNVLLPEYMRGFIPSLIRDHPRVQFTWVEYANNVQVGYYNDATRLSSQINIRVPNYQAAIDNLILRGNRKMLTHISNVD